MCKNLVIRMFVLTVRQTGKDRERGRASETRKESEKANDETWNELSNGFL